MARPGSPLLTYPPRPPTPAGILGTLLHSDFDAADPGIVLNGSAAASLPNRGPDGAALEQATAGAQPIFNATSFAGGPGLTFDKTNDTMLCTFASPLAIGTRPYMWTVFKANNTGGGYQVPASIYSAGAALTYLVVYQCRTGDPRFSVQVSRVSGSLDTIYDGATETTKTHLIECGYTVNGLKAVVIDGVESNVQPAVSDALTVAISYMRWGAYAPTATQFGGSTVRRVIVAKDMPTQTQIDDMRAYLKARPYGFAF